LESQSIKNFPTVVYYPQSNKRGEHYKGALDKKALSKYIKTYKFLETVDTQAGTESQLQATRMEDEIARYEEAHGHHMLERPHVEFTGGGMVISESFTLDAGQSMEDIMNSM